jgi:dienelactone hydrolase
MSWGDPDREFLFRGPLGPLGKKTAEHMVYVGGSGPAILLLQELPGIDAPTISLADLLAENFTVYLPHLVGEFGKTEGTKNMLRLFCVRREINLFATGKNSPISDWLRALSSRINHETGGTGIGVIGMCLTGHFAISLMADRNVIAGVASQPSLPMTLFPYTSRKLQMSDAEIADTNTALKAKGPALAMRFKCDKISRKPLMKGINEAFGKNVRISSYPGRKHSLLTGDFEKDAWKKVETYFKNRLGTAKNHRPT